jgi:hypothetical protein
MRIAAAFEGHVMNVPIEGGAIVFGSLERRSRLEAERRPAHARRARLMGVARRAAASHDLMNEQ